MKTSILVTTKKGGKIDKSAVVDKKKGIVDAAQKDEIRDELVGYRYKVIKKTGFLQNRIIIGIPLTGTVRAEWMLARYGQVIPCNWAQTESIQWIDQYSPINFLVADARNLVANECILKGFEWLLFIDHDVILPPDFFLKINDYMLKAEYPVMSGLYFTKSIPSEPLLYRGNGNSYYREWEFGDKVKTTAVPMGCTLIHSSIIQAIYDEAETISIGGRLVKKIFETPAKVWQDPETMAWNSATGTEDLAFCHYAMTHKIFEKAGWPEYENMEYPFLVDTSIFCHHIDESGRRFPLVNEDKEFTVPVAERKRQAKLLLQQEAKKKKKG